MKKFILIIFVISTAILAVPNHTLAASLYLTPSTGNLAVGDEFTVTVLTDTKGAAVNTAESNITYTTNTLELESVTQGSTFLIPTPASPNKSAGSAYFGGGLPTPGFNGSNGVLGVMKFKAKAVGRATVNIIRGTMLLNDGSGTQAITQTTGASFNITAAAVGTVTVISSNHTTQDAWSNINNLDLSWVVPAGTGGVSYSLDQDPAGIPDDTVDATDMSSISYSSLKDGSWYFHIKAKGKGPNDPYGPVTNYKVQIDTAAPLPFQLNLVSESDTQHTSTTPTIEYKAEDSTSGVYRYDVFIDNKLAKELAVSPFSFPKTDIGPHSIRVVAVDRAGNSTSSDLSINVTNAGAQPITYADLRKLVLWPILILILINLMVILAVAYLFSQRKKNYRLNEQVNAQMQKVQLVIEKVAGFEAGMTNLRREFDVKLRQMSDIRVAAPTPVAAKVQSEMNQNVERLSQQINIWFTEFSQTHTKDEMAKLQLRLEEQIQKEIDKNIQMLHEFIATKMAGNQLEQQQTQNEIRSRIEMLEKLKSQVLNSQDWRGKVNPNNL